MSHATSASVATSPVHLPKHQRSIHDCSLYDVQQLTTIIARPEAVQHFVAAFHDDNTHTSRLAAQSQHQAACDTDTGVASSSASSSTPTHTHTASHCDDGESDEYYFCFGSNMNASRMLERGVTWRTREVAWLEMHELTFNKAPSHIPQEEWRCGHTPGAATIQQITDTQLIQHYRSEHGVSPGIFGILYHVTRDSLSKLDVYEGVTQGHYYRSTVPVYTSTGTLIHATTYIAHADSTWHGGLVPAQEYLLHILAGRDILPASYVEQLSAIPTCQHRLPHYLRQGSSALHADDVADLQHDIVAESATAERWLGKQVT